MIFSAVILAGGQSSRMGRDKATVELGGQTLLARQLALARGVGATEIFISGRAGFDYGVTAARILTDRFPNAGPLAGIERALAEMSASQLLVLAVDMPRLTAELLQKLAQVCGKECGVVPEIRGRIEPLAAFYPQRAHDFAVKMLMEERSNSNHRTPGPTDFARRGVDAGMLRLVTLSDAEAELFANVNSPEDLPPESMLRPQ
jgi:molybdopterin-guanine dinucleotide biosynthesis protein A